MGMWTTWQARMVALMIALICLGVALGCGGAKTNPAPENSRSASVSFTVRWPERTRLIPLAAQSIRVQLRDARLQGLEFFIDRLIPRPASGVSTLTFNDLPVQDITITVKAFDDANGFGTELATGFIPVTLKKNQTIAVTLTLQSTIEQVKIFGNDGVTLRPGQQRTISAQALNSKGENVLVDSSAWEWTSSNTRNFTLTPSGDSATIAALSQGTATITLRDKESQKSVTALIASNNGLGIAFGSQRGTNDKSVYMVNPDGTGLVKVTDDASSHYGFSISPDGTKVACTKNDSQGFQIYLSNNDGTDAQSLTTGSKSSWMPRFSPNGKKIAFNHEEGISNKPDIYVMNADGTQQINITKSKDTQKFIELFSPDSAYIIYSIDNNGSYDICRVNIDGTNTMRLTNNNFNDVVYDISKDGRKIVFYSNRDGNNEIYIMNWNGSGQTRLTNNPGTDSQPIFSPDGKKIAYTSEQNGNRDIYIMNTDGSNQTRLTTFAGFDTSPRFSPDGTKLVFHRHTDHDTIFTMNVDGTDQQNVSLEPGTDFDPVWFQLRN